MCLALQPCPHALCLRVVAAGGVGCVCVCMCRAGAGERPNITLRLGLESSQLVVELSVAPVALAFLGVHLHQRRHQRANYNRVFRWTTAVGDHRRRTATPVAYRHTFFV